MLDLNTLRERCSNGETFQYVFFWGHRLSKTGKITKSCFSQWYRSPFEINGTLYPTAEHWMMASKARLFGDQEILAKILDCSEPKTAKALGRKVRGYDDSVWKQNARRLVTEGMRSVVLHVTGASYQLGDIPPGASAKARVRSTGESGLEIEFTDPDEKVQQLDAGGYFESGYRGTIHVSIKNGTTVTNQQDIKLW
jgi:predicted NAD-dependent protein-ADP-ribosyltransferase YbiA (DUF1768 family)